MIENIVKIQGAIDLARGGLQIAKMGPVVGGVTALVTAGAGAWMLYSQQVARAKKEIEGLAESHHKASQAETKAMQERESIAAKGQAGRTDATFDSGQRRDAQKKELDAIHQRRAEAEEQFGTADKARFEATQKAERLKSVASTLAESTFQGIQEGKGAGQSRFEATARERLMKEAAKREESAGEYAGRQEANIKQRQQDAEREQAILQQQRTEREQEIRAKESQEIERMRHADSMMSDQSKARREADDFLYNMKRQQFASATRGMAGVGGFMEGGAMGVFSTSTPQDLREAGTHWQAQRGVDRMNQEMTKAAQVIVSTLQSLSEEMTKIKQAHP